MYSSRKRIQEEIHSGKVKPGPFLPPLDIADHYTVITTCILSITKDVPAQCSAAAVVCVCVCERDLKCGHTRCCNPQLVLLQSGTVDHCAHMGSWFHWCNLLVHLTPAHQDIRNPKYNLYLSAFSQKKKRVKDTWATDWICTNNISGMYKFCVWVYVCIYIHTHGGMSKLPQLLWHSTPVVPGGALEQSK